MSIRINKGNFKINAYAKGNLTFIPPPTPTTTPTATVGTTPTPTQSPTPTGGPFQLNVFSGNTSQEACDLLYPAVVYSLHPSLFDSIGSILYQNSSLTIVVNPNALFADGTGYVFILDSTSTVVDNPLCSIAETPTPTPTLTPSITVSATQTQTPNPTPTSTPTSFNSGSVKLSNNDATICDTPVLTTTVYWSSSFPTIDTNVTLYYDSALTNPVTGYTFVVQNIPGYQIFEVNPSNGLVTGPTVLFCAGTPTPTPTPTLTPSSTLPITPTPTNTLTPTVSPTANLTSSGLIGYYDLYNSETPDGFNSDFDACSGTTSIYNITLYWNGTFGDGTTLYEDNQGLTLFESTSLGYYYYSGNSFNLIGATVFNTESCVEVTPTPTQTPTVTQTMTPTTTVTPSPTSGATFNFILLPIDTICYNYNYVNSSGNSSVLRYMDCNGNAQSVNVNNGGSGTFCAQRGAYVSTPSNSITITEATSCGVFNPTPTPTATNTPTPTIGSCIDCREITFDGNITHASLMAYWTSCDGLPQSFFVVADTTYGPVCAILGTASGQAFTTGPSCGNSCPTPTITPTQTTTPTPTATPFPSTGFQVSAFSSNAISQTTGQYQIVAMAGDFNKKVPGYVFVSNNYGANFTGVRIPGYWRSVGVSDDGRYMLAAGYNETAPFTYKSSDYGVTWVQIPNTSFPAPINYRPTSKIYSSSVAISNDGQYQVIGTDANRFDFSTGGWGIFFCLYVSNDYGSTWTLAYYEDYGLVSLFTQVSMSSNGQNILATASSGIIDLPYGGIYRSNNFGVSFASVSSTLGVNKGTSVSISRDGTHAIAAFNSPDNTTLLRYSQNSGATWNNITSGSTPSRTWSTVAIFDDAVSGMTAYASTTVSSGLARIVNLETTPAITQLSPTKNCNFRLSVSNSGQYIIVRDTVGIWRSANYGATFNYLTS